ncbi:MAG: putative lipid II flippase FtsW [Candidatus Falkowbacteria bacterium]
MGYLKSKIGSPAGWLKGVDSWLLIIIGLLLAFGLMMLASASSVVAYGATGDSYYFVKRQALAILVGLPLFFILAKFNYKRLRDVSLVFLVINVLILVFVLIFGKSVNGTRGWIGLFGYNYQPSETLKFVYLTYLAAVFSGRNQPKEAFRTFIISFVVVGLLIGLQPDIGTLFVLAVASVAVLFAAKVPLKYLTILITLGALVLGILAVGSSHQRDRFRCLLDSNYSPRDKCYQLNQSLLALGSGGFFGRGLGESRQKFLYLPEVQNDFIFAIIGEEMGFLFAAGVIVLYALLFWRVYLIAQASNDPFGKLLAIGFVFWICFQALLNIGGIARVLPMTGVPLPFISYGGSSMITLLAAAGVLVNISREG